MWCSIDSRCRSSSPRWRAGRRLRSSPPRSPARAGSASWPAATSGADALREGLARTRALTSAPIAVNLFVPGAPSDPAAYEPYVALLAAEADRDGVALGAPRFDDDDWGAKLALLADDPVAAVSFTFGCPHPAVIGRLRAAGSEVWVTVTSPDEALLAAEAGADVLVVQGAEAGGHRATFIDDDAAPVYGLLALLQLVREAVDLPLVATGGLATAEAVAAVRSAGARAAQIGTAFLLCPEAGTSPAHRAAVASPAPTALTRAFSGRLARGIRNRFMDDYGDAAPVAYPEIHHVTSPLRAAARARGDAGTINLWAGEAHALAVERPAADVVRALAGGAGA